MNNEEIMVQTSAQQQALVDNMTRLFFENASKVVSDEDLKRIRNAYKMAHKAHADQIRKSGIPYITHPISVARIVCEVVCLGSLPIISALLHVFVEDSDFTIEDIRNCFGGDVAFLVDVVPTQYNLDSTLSK